MAALAQTKPAAATLSCPESIKVTETAVPIGGWKAAPAQVEHAFERVSIYNGQAGGQEFDLAPDDEKQSGGKTIQTWNLKNYRSMNIFLRCRYHDTTATLHMDAPANLTSCVLTFTLDKKGVFLDKSSLICR